MGTGAGQGEARGLDQHEMDYHGTAAQLALGKALRAMHQRSNRTLRTVERDVAISDSTLSRYFRGRAVPSWPTVEKICASFGEDAAAVRPLWVAAIAERSNSAFPAAPDAPVDAGATTQQAATNGSDNPDIDADAAAHTGTSTSTSTERRHRAVWLGVGLVIGFALGVGLTASATLTAGATSAPSSLKIGAGSAGTGTSTPRVGQPTPTGTSCPWKYVVTDGNPDPLRVFDDPQRDSLIARYAPNEVFYAPDPPQIINGMMKTEDGWVSLGDWVQRYSHTACRTG